MPTVADIAALLNVPASGDSSRQLSGIANLRDAGATDLSFLNSDAYLEQFSETHAAAVIVDASIRETVENASTRNSSSASLLIVQDADLAMALALQFFAPPIPVPELGIDRDARVSPKAVLGEGVRVGPFAFVGRGTRIGRSTVVHAGAFIGDDVVIGDDCQILPNVTIRERVTIGNRVILNAGCVIGTDGFGYKWSASLDKYVKLPHIGTVIIEDDVEIGSCTCVDRAKFAATTIGRGSKLDNLIQVAHNVIIGPTCVLVAQSGVAGSAKLGTHVTIGGQSAIRDHITVGDRASVASVSAVYSDVEPDSVVGGIPADLQSRSLRSQAALRRLPDLVKKVRQLQLEVEALQAAQKSSHD